MVDLNILQHMVESKAEYIMELTDKTKTDVNGGTIVDYGVTGVRGRCIRKIHRWPMKEILEE